MSPRNISKNEQTKEFKKLRSNFILKKIFILMEINKSLEILRYNKKLQKRLNISIDNYKKSSKIEIELKLSDYKYSEKFINIPDKGKKYYHIYFDNSNEEIKRNYLEYSDNFKMIKIKIDYQIK